MDNIKEIFIPIDGFDKYFISNMGNVKSDKTNIKKVILSPANKTEKKQTIKKNIL
jgi:hypothetical protein